MHMSLTIPLYVYSQPHKMLISNCFHFSRPKTDDSHASLMFSHLAFPEKAKEVQETIHTHISVVIPFLVHARIIHMKEKDKHKRPKKPMKKLLRHVCHHLTHPYPTQPTYRPKLQLFPRPPQPTFHILTKHIYTAA